jgi:hypothetical protein
MVSDINKVSNPTVVRSKFAKYKGNDNAKLELSEKADKKYKVVFPYNGTDAVAIGTLAGQNMQGTGTIAIGLSAGQGQVLLGIALLLQILQLERVRLLILGLI